MSAFVREVATYTTGLTKGEPQYAVFQERETIFGNIKATRVFWNNFATYAEAKEIAEALNRGELRLTTSGWEYKKND